MASAAAAIDRAVTLFFTMDGARTLLTKEAPGAPDWSGEEAANADKGWGVDLGEVARIWKGGCIIRARFLESIQAAFRAEGKLPNLLLDPQLGGFLQQHQGAWRRVVALAAERGVPVLAMGASLSYFDSYRRASLP